MDHYRMRHNPADEREHCVFLDANAYQCWCYECDDMIYPPIFVEIEPRDDSQTISSVNSSNTSKRKTSKTSICQFPAGVIGLYNLGNSCYMNAAIQTLLNCPSIVGYFRNCSAFIYRNNHHRISESFHKLIDAIFHTNMPVFSPSRLVREVKMINPMFHGYTQQDTMDFIRCIFERIHDELGYTLKRTKKNEDNDSLNQRRRSERLAKHDVARTNSIPLKSRDNAQHRSIISDTFGGLLRSEIHCQECDCISVKDDLFYDVSIQICASSEGLKPSKSSLSYIGNFFNSIGETIGLNGKPVRLETCLAAFCAPETLEGKDRYRCEKCNRLVRSKKTLKFMDLPRVLVIQMKRFRHESYFSSKIGTHVIFPMDNLDLTPYLHESTSESIKQETRYYLSAIISHRGTFGGGHYIAYCRNLSSGQWLEFDDSAVTVISEEEVGKVQAYVLFYSMVDWNARKEREEWLSTIPEEIPDAVSDLGIFMSRQWLNRWSTMASPGPIDNSEFMCPHDLLAPEKIIDPIQLVQFVPQRTFDYFVTTYGEYSGANPLREATVCAKCVEEGKELDERRKMEERDIQALDTSFIKAGEYWYLISSEWLVAWGQFKTGTGPPPGPISNDQLIVNDHPRPNLIRGTHYRGVNRRVWDYFIKTYGGGPTIVRRTINIYGAAPDLSGPDPGESNMDDVYVDVVGH